MGKESNKSKKKNDTRIPRVTIDSNQSPLSSSLLSRIPSMIQSNISPIPHIPHSIPPNQPNTSANLNAANGNDNNSSDDESNRVETENQNAIIKKSFTFKGS